MDDRLAQHSTARAGIIAHRVFHVSDRRTDAILLDALIQDDPDADLIPKLVNGLLAHSVNGRWGSTQENVFVLVALDRYFNTYESVEPDFVARMWLGEGYVGEHAYQGYSTDYTQTVVPMSYLVDQQPETITLEKQGDGRLYYRLGLRYAPEACSSTRWRWASLSSAAMRRWIFPRCHPG